MLLRNSNTLLSATFYEGEWRVESVGDVVSRSVRALYIPVFVFRRGRRHSVGRNAMVGARPKRFPSVFTLDRYTNFRLSLGQTLFLYKKQFLRNIKSNFSQTINQTIQNTSILSDGFKLDIPLRTD